MSSLYVRTKVREWAAQLSLPFFDTVNVNQPDPPAPSWLTVQFMVAQAGLTDYCNGQAERGTFDFIVLTRGNSSDTVLAQAEADLKQFMAQRDPTGQLTLIVASPFEDFYQPGSARWFTLSAAVDYQYFHH